MSESKCAKIDCVEVPEQRFQVEKSLSVENPGAHLTLEISVNQELESMLVILVIGEKEHILFPSNCMREPPILNFLTLGPGKSYSK